MAESISVEDELDYPVFIICPEPGFKASFFKELGNSWRPGPEHYLWKIDYYRDILENVPSMTDAYKNMSYILGEDWNAKITFAKNFHDAKG